MGSIVLFEPRLRKVLEAFEEALTYRELRYALSALKRYGFQSDIEIMVSLKRAVEVCNGLGIDPKRHFGYFYKVDMVNRQTIKEWRASQIGFYLVLCNGSSSNPFTGALQIEMLTDFLYKLE